MLTSLQAARFTTHKVYKGENNANTSPHSMRFWVLIDLKFIKITDLPVKAIAFMLF